MFSARNVVLLLAAVVVGLGSYWAFATWQKRAQHNAIAGAVADGTAQLKAALVAPPTAENIAAIEAAIERLQSTNVSRQIALAGAAGTYLSAARTVMLRRADAERIAPQAEASRAALAAHMNTPRGRNDDWIRRAADLKRKMDGDQIDLDRVLKTLAELLATLPEVEKPLQPFLAPSYVLDEATRLAAQQRAEQQAKAAAEETAKIGTIQR